MRDWCLRGNCSSAVRALTAPNQRSPVQFLDGHRCVYFLFLSVLRQAQVLYIEMGSSYLILFIAVQPQFIDIQYTQREKLCIDLCVGGS